jgi:GTP cyclohydrolase I
VGETVRLCKMNLAIHGLAGDIRQSNTYYEDVHNSVGRFDFVAANPPFNVDKVDKERIARAVGEILAAIGEDPGRAGLQETPARVARMYEEVCAGLVTDPGAFLRHTFKEEHHELVILKDIPFYSLCEHHLLPFMGAAHVAYLPKGRLVGISKLARVVDAFARRPQVQERLTSQIADLLLEKLQPLGVAVLLEATHTCMTMRGVQKPGAVMITSAIRGIFRENHAARDEVWAHFQRRRSL